MKPILARLQWQDELVLILEFLPDRVVIAKREGRLAVVDLDDIVIERPTGDFPQNDFSTFSRVGDELMASTGTKP